MFFYMLNTEVFFAFVTFFCTFVTERSPKKAPAVLPMCFATKIDLSLY